MNQVKYNPRCYICGKLVNKTVIISIKDKGEKIAVGVCYKCKKVKEDK